MAFFRIIKTGFINFWRNFWLSVAATSVMTITLVIFSVLFLLFAMTSYSIKTIQNTVDISVYFQVGASQDQINKVEQDLQADSQVKEVSLISADQALQNFKAQHANDPNITASLNELSDNPLPATLHVKANTLDEYPTIAEKLQSSEYAGSIKVNYEDNRAVIDRLNKILTFVITIGIGVVIIFSIIAVLVIFNTITLTILNRKEEVEIMRLVGATNSYIRGPFLVESFMYSFISTVITGALLTPIFTKILPRITEYINPQLTLYNHNVFNYWYIIIAIFVLSFVLSVFTTWVAIRKYLKI